MSGTSTIRQFQNYIWGCMPVRREVVGREVIDDVVLTAIQLWPVEYLSQTNNNSQEQMIVLSTLAGDVRRILTFVYGEDRFRGYWLVGLRGLILRVIEVMTDWWVRRKDNRAKMNTWRRRWVIE